MSKSELQVWIVRIDGSHVLVESSNDRVLVQDVYDRIRNGEKGTLPNRWDTTPTPTADRLLAECHPPHPQPEICDACRYLGRVPGQQKPTRRWPARMSHTSVEVIKRNGDGRREEE